MTGWVKLHRKIKDWEYYNDPPTKILFLHLLLSVNHETKIWRGIEIKPGQLLTSVRKLSSETGLSAQQTRRALNNTQKSKQTTQSTTSKYTIITITNWSKYQGEEQTNNTQPNKQTTHNPTTTKEERNKEERNNNIYAVKFTEFWKAYPRKEGGKQKAEKYYRDFLKSGIAHDEIMQGLENYKKQIKIRGTEKQYIAHATTWLYQKRWEAEYETEKTSLDNDDIFRIAMEGSE